MRARMTPKRRIGIAAVALAFALTGCVRGLAVDAGRSNRIIGFFSWDRGYLGDPRYVDRMDEFSMVQPYMHDWLSVEPQPGVWNTGQIADDEQYWNSLGRQYIWPGEMVWAHEDQPGSKIPAYLKGMTSAQLWSALSEHIYGLIGRHRHVWAWDVVSEIFHQNSAGDIVLRDNVFKQKLGNDWAAQALRYAHAADPNAIVVISEFNADGMSAKADALYNYVKAHLVADSHADRVPVDKLAVGLEMHMSSCAPNDGFTNPMASDIQKNMQRFSNLGVKVFIQGMDVQLRCAGGSYQQQLDWQKAKYHNVVAACVAVPRCAAIVIEGIGDPDSWIVRLRTPSEHPVLFDNNYNAKPAYYGVQAALRGQ
jgi:endo-1,4-beta-xylanase